jgi:hypothetical protein
MSQTLQAIIKERTAHALILREMSKTAKTQEERNAIICGYVLIESSINKMKEMSGNGYVYA